SSRWKSYIDPQAPDGSQLATESRAPAIAANCSMVRDSPRAPGSTPAFVTIPAAGSAPPAQPASAARNVLRRWAKAASTTAKTFSRATAAGGRRVVKATSPDSTLGTGQKTFAGTFPACRAVANQASLALGMPYTLEPGGAV